MDIIPHDKLAKRKVADNGLLLDIPSLLNHDGPTDRVEDQRDIHATLVARQRIETSDLNAKILSQHLQQCDIQHGILVPAPDHISLSGRFADYLDWQ